MWSMSDVRKRILSPFTGCKKQKTWNKTRVKYKPVQRQSLAETDRGSYYNKEEWLEEFLDDYNENNGQQQLQEGLSIIATK